MFGLSGESREEVREIVKSTITNSNDNRLDYRLNWFTVAVNRAMQAKYQEPELVLMPHKGRDAKIALPLAEAVQLLINHLNLVYEPETTDTKAAKLVKGKRNG